MLKFILALLAMQAMGMNAATLSSTGITDLDLTNIKRTPNVSIANRQDPFVPCDFPENFAFLAKCFCFSVDAETYAIDRKYMVDAMDNACQYFTGGIGEPISVYGTASGLVPSYTYIYTYPPSHSHEDGKIVVALVVDQSDPNCAGPIPIGWHTCWDTLHDPLDHCDSDAENGKNGGLYLNECVWWIIDPAPSTNQPYPFGVTCKDCDNGEVAQGRWVGQ